MKTLFRLVRISIYITVIVYFVQIIFFNNAKFEWNKDVLLSLLIGFMYTFAITTVNVTNYQFLSKQLPWEKEPKKRLITGFITGTIYTLICLYVLKIITVVFIFDKGWAYFFAQDYKVSYLFGLTITLIANLVFHLIYFYKKSAENKVKVSTISANATTAQFESLKNQLDPHFLFNSLNVLMSLIGEDPDKAEDFTSKLAKVYRYVLEQRNKTLVPISEEISFAKSYLDLLKMRFEDAVTTSINVEGIDENQKIVPLSLQLLLENAVKHNQVSSKKPLFIEIFVEDGYLKIRNNYIPKKIIEKSTKVGLSNINDRYQMLTSQPVLIEQTKKQFCVNLPILESQEEFVVSESEYILTKAKEHIKLLKTFYLGMIFYVIFIPAMIAFNYYTFWDIKWFVFPMIGMGIGMVFNGLRVFTDIPILGQKWEKAQVQKMMKE